MHVAVAGAGIAGLTAAIALARRGFHVEVFERSHAAESGAGIQISPNASAVLERLDVLADLADKIVEPSAIEIRGHKGMLLTRIPLGATARHRYGSPYCLIARADLVAGLLAAANRQGNITIGSNADVRDVRGSDDGVAFTAGGEDRHADALIAADGVRSRVRTELFGHNGPVSTGKAAWRATIAVENTPQGIDCNVTGVWMAAGAHLVHYPMAGGTKLNLVVIAADSAADAPDQKPFPPDVRRLLRGPATWQRWQLLTLDKDAAWARGRAVLIGDAAHAMAPSAAQGGAQAIEDAWVVAECLAASANSPAEAFRRHDALRRKRVARVVNEAERNLAVFEMRGLAALGRDLAIKAVPPIRHLARRDWLYGWRPESFT